MTVSVAVGELSSRRTLASSRSKGRDTYNASTLDYVDSSCEEDKLHDTGGPPLILLAGAALLLGSGLVMSRSVIRRI
jgi:hypothetical protein